MDAPSCGSRSAGYKPASEALQESGQGEEPWTRYPITKSGFAKLKRELDNLKSVAIPQNIKDIEIARGHGDLSENAEYTAAKERQSYLHGRVQELENNLACANVIELKNLSCDKVVFGSTVAIEEINTGKGITYKLLGPFESDLEKNRISVTSPIGRGP